MTSFFYRVGGSAYSTLAEARPQCFRLVPRSPVEDHAFRVTLDICRVRPLRRPDRDRQGDRRFLWLTPACSHAPQSVTERLATGKYRRSRATLISITVNGVSYRAGPFLNTPWRRLEPRCAIIVAATKGH